MTGNQSDCDHPETRKKFSGMELCADCNAFLGYWSKPGQTEFSAVQNADGTFTVLNPEDSR